MPIISMRPVARATFVLVAALPLPAQSGTGDGDCRCCGGEAQSITYSSLDQVNRENVSTLQTAWIWKTQHAESGECRPSAAE